MAIARAQFVQLSEFWDAHATEMRDYCPDAPHYIRAVLIEIGKSEPLYKQLYI